MAAILTTGKIFAGFIGTLGRSKQKRSNISAEKFVRDGCAIENLTNIQYPAMAGNEKAQAVQHQATKLASCRAVLRK